MSTPRTGWKAAARSILDASGVTAISRGALEVIDGSVEKMVEAARDHGATEAQIRKALRLRDRWERAQSLAALALPVIPNPYLLRKIAGQERKSPAEKKAVKSKRSR